MSILKKSVREMTPDDRLRLTRKIGERHPYPMTAPGYLLDKDGKPQIVRYLGLLERPIEIYSEKSLDEVEGIMMRDMVTPEMLGIEFKILSLLKPENRNRAVLVTGAPGGGKTFAGEKAGRMISEKGAITVDCTGLNLIELFFETVLDFKSGQKFFGALDERIRQYNAAIDSPEKREALIHSVSVDVLRECLGDAFSQDDKGRISVDWSRVKNGGSTLDPLTGAEKYTPPGHRMEILKKGLEQVNAWEKITDGGTNILGMATQKGPAVRAWEEGRILILDEFNRAKKGTFGITHGFLQMVIGEKTSCTVNNPLKEKGDRFSENVEMNAVSLKPGFMVYMTGNTEDDGDEVLELPEALSSRILRIQLPALTVRGWQHRFCQRLVGIPVSTHYYANQNHWDRNPGEFAEHLAAMRILGEKNPPSADELSRLKRKWSDIVDASEKFGEFMHEAARMVNPDSHHYRDAASLGQLMDEISESFKKELSVDLRKINHFISSAALEKPVVRPTGSGHEKVVPLILADDISDTADDADRKIGTHLTYVIIDWIVSNTFDRGKDKLGLKLMALAQDKGLFSLGTGLSQQPVSSGTLAELLDDNMFDSDQPEVRARLARDLLCHYLRSRDMSLRDVPNDDLIASSTMQALLEQVQPEDDDLFAEEEGRSLYLFDAANGSSPLTPAQIVDPVDRLNKNSSDPQNRDAGPDGDLCTKSALLFALAAPGLQERALLALWARSFSSVGLAAAREGLPRDESLAMAEGDSQAGLCVTSVDVKPDDDQKSEAGRTPLHLIWNKNAGRGLVVGTGPVESRLQSALKEAHVVYIDKMHKGADRRLRQELARIIDADNYDRQESLLKTAFLYRAALPAREGEEKLDLTEIMMRRDLRPVLPLEIRRMPAPA